MKIFYSFSQAYRAQRIVEVIEQKTKFTIEDSIDLQNDVITIAGQELSKRILELNINNQDEDINIAIEQLKVFFKKNIGT